MARTGQSTRSRYWVELSHDGNILGGGLLIQRGGVILTAAHCLRGLPPDQEEFDATLGSGQKLRVRVEEVVDWDLALLVAVNPEECDVPPPHSDSCRSKDPWSAPYRPSVTDPHLDGQVIVDECTYGLTGGAEVRALQLGVNQLLGSYAGYSGGPVEAELNGRPRLVGVLLEQYPDRSHPERASNVLFAARIQQALLRFRRFDMANLFPGMVLPGRMGAVDETEVERRLRRLRVWRETEVISNRTAKIFELRILEDWIRPSAGDVGG
ncbi:trypsin-like serine protease [Actinoplanes sp. NPDC026670]|uniref:trypsin-like serine protease n=1 Tax=Actinoplanes sp. NPDC026670 TaxID=3154700 RepID=UPI0033C12CF3